MFFQREIWYLQNSAHQIPFESVLHLPTGLQKMMQAQEHELELANLEDLYLGAPKSPLDCFVVLRVSIGGGRDPIGAATDVFCGMVLGGTSYVGSCIDTG